jgi:aminoglycoside 3-N-acetyltransferase I
MDIEIHPLNAKDLQHFKALIAVFEEVFEMENFVCPDDHHLLRLLEKENFIAITAQIADQVIGGLTVYVLEQYYSTKPLAYIYDLAVLTAFQRKGIGKQLIEFIQHYCSEKGFEEIFVQADKVDVYAIDFYRLTKPTTEEQVIHFNYSLN